MKRRTVLAAIGAASGGSALLTSTGAFTSVSADRDVTVEVTGDADAFLRLAPCTDDTGNEQPNAEYVVTSGGQIGIDLTDSNDPPSGDGVNPEALSVFDNVFEVCNQGTQDVCVDLQIDVPDIPSGADVPDRYDFTPGDPAVVFYRNGSSDDRIPADVLDPDTTDALSIGTGECECIGFAVRSFGFSSTDAIFDGEDLTIKASASAQACTQPGPSGGSGTLPTSRLVGYWPFDNDDVDDGIATDASGNGNHGTVEGPTSATGAGNGGGNAAGFDGTDDYIDLPDGTALPDHGESITVSAWVRTSADKRQVVYRQNPLDSWVPAYNLEYGFSQQGTDDALRWHFGDPGDELVDSSFDPDGTWQHVAAVADTTGGRVAVYLDGTKLVEDTTVSFGSTTATPERNIGRYSRQDTGQNGGYWDGRIDEVRIYDRALSDAEVQSLANQFNP